ncbi:MAG: YHS domain-containing protein [Acidobacteriia bacterium]|nr:YHS domain-containing protein [Terriglobia bacterium]
MRRGVYLILALGFIGLVAAAFFATQTAAQTVCPVSGEAIDTKFSVDYQGQRVYFCCPKCPAEFRADPEKFFAKLASTDARLENIQVTCPVSGENLANDTRGQPIEVQYKGRTVRLCCKTCRPKFEADPARYLAALPGNG